MNIILGLAIGYIATAIFFKCIDETEEEWRERIKREADRKR
jgi:hypothetical protein